MLCSGFASAFWVATVEFLVVRWGFLSGSSAAMRDVGFDKKRIAPTVATADCIEYCIVVNLFSNWVQAGRIDKKPG